MPAAGYTHNVHMSSFSNTKIRANPKGRESKLLSKTMENSFKLPVLVFCLARSITFLSHNCTSIPIIINKHYWNRERDDSLVLSLFQKPNLNTKSTRQRDCQKSKATSMPQCSFYNGYESAMFNYLWTFESLVAKPQAFILNPKFRAKNRV